MKKVGCVVVLGGLALVLLCNLAPGLVQQLRKHPRWGRCLPIRFTWGMCNCLSRTCNKEHKRYMGEDSVLGSPSIAADLIDRVLSAYGSPAAGTGQSLYDGGVAVQALTRYGRWPSSCMKTRLARPVLGQPTIVSAIFAVRLAIAVRVAFAPMPPGKHYRVRVCSSFSMGMSKGVCRVPVPVRRLSRLFPSMRPVVMATTYRGILLHSCKRRTPGVLVASL